MSIRYETLADLNIGKRSPDHFTNPILLCSLFTMCAYVPPSIIVPISSGVGRK